MQTPVEMAAIFERIRAAVYQEATRPSSDDAAQHTLNQATFKNKLKQVCARACLRDDLTADELWGHVWTKIRYAGFRSSYASDEIPRLEAFFGDFRVITAPEWQFDPSGLAHGPAVQEFLDKSGRFAGVRYSRLAPKLHKMLSAAATFRAFPSEHSPLEALFGDGYRAPGDEALWHAHDRLARLVGYTTALHIMMDIGFDCVKPDIWLVRLMCRLGWIEDTLPATSAEAVIQRNYQKPRTAVAVITRARQIAAVLPAWHPEAPLREFDFVMVKYGQRPGECGIERSLHDSWLPVERIREWQPPA